MNLLPKAAYSIFVASIRTLSNLANTQTDKPNILVIMGDDIGYWNLSYNNDAMMGYKTPNIDRIATEGISFTDYYAQQSCTAGRADTDSNNYNHWWSQRVYTIGPAQRAALTFLQTYKEFPPRQKPASFNLDEVMKEMDQQVGGK